MPKIVKVPNGTNFNLDPVQYRGRNILPLKKISNGTTPGGQVTIDFVVGKNGIGNRKHGADLLCQAVNYTGGVALATTKLGGGGNNGLTLTPTLVNREPTTAAVVAGGTGYTTGDQVQLVDATGAGATYTVTAAGGIVSAVAYVAGSAVASPVEPDYLIQNPVISIGSATPYQVDAKFYSMRRQVVGGLVPLGIMPIDFSDPQTDFVQGNDETSWDTYGAGQMTMSFTINLNAVKPSVTGWEDFDGLRNSFTDARGAHLFQNPLKLTKQTIDLINGTVEIQNLTIIGAVRRIWVVCNTTPGTISAMEFWADGQQRLQGNVVDIFRRYRDFGFHFGDKVTYALGNIASSNTLKGALNPFNWFDAAYIADFDGRLRDVLNLSNHNLKLTSSVAQKASVYIETLPGSFV